MDTNIEQQTRAPGISLPDALWLFVLTLWLGTMISTNLIAPPIIFHVIDAQGLERTLAGSIAGGIFARQGLVTLTVLLLTCTASAVMGTLRGKIPVPTILLALAVLLSLAEMFWITPSIHEIRTVLTEEFGGVALAPEGHPLRAKFGMMHGVSVLRAAGEFLLGFAALVVGWRRLTTVQN